MAGGWPEQQDMRSWLANLDEHGELGRVRSLIDPHHKVAAVLEQADGRRAALFCSVAAARYPLAGNLVLGRAHLARAMGCPSRAAAAVYAAALRTPRPWASVDADDAPVLSHRLDAARLLATLPLPVQHERDAGRYLTCGVLIVRDPVSGRTNLSINRMLAAGEQTLHTLVLPGRLHRILREAEARGRDLDVAIVVGADPLLALASQAPACRDHDELEVASALYAEPLPVTRAPSTGLPVPANTEFLLEGRFRASARGPEGPFGEFPRTYGPPAPAPVVDLIAGWCRESAVFQTILSGGREHLLLGAVPREAVLAETLRRAGFDVGSVRLPELGSCRLYAYVALRDPAPGIAVNALLTVLGTATTVKCAVVVDDDVDIFDDEQVGWAIATRTQADRDLVIVPGAKGSSLDPSAQGPTAKVGIDATVSAARRGRHARMKVGPHDRERVERFLAELGRSQ